MSNGWELRNSCSLSQVELAKQLHVSKQTISNWENNNVPPSIDTLIRIANFFDVSTDYLLEFNNERKLNVEGLSDSQIAHIQAIIQDILT
ncbi:MAG: helix-turn-helix transcriptional regulator [Eubacterium sp.]|nr:helix-turn-helix transcriptional regulator [Eubacterium sp.]